jgi:hypothetical protein
VRGSRLLDGPVDVQPFEDLLPAHQAGIQARVTALTKRIALVHIGCMRDRKSPGTTGTLSSLVSGSSAVARALGAASSGSERNRPAWDGGVGREPGGERSRQGGRDVHVQRDRGRLVHGCETGNRAERRSMSTGCSCARSTTTRPCRPMTCTARSPGSRTACTCCGSSSSARVGLRRRERSSRSKASGSPLRVLNASAT